MKHSHVQGAFKKFPRLRFFAGQIVNFVIGALGTFAAIGMLTEAPWAKQLLIILGGALAIKFVLKVIKVKAEVQNNSRCREVVEEKVCPGWYLDEIKEKASIGGFSRELDERLKVLGEPSSGIVVMNAFQLAKKDYRKRVAS